jgi:hypothetical protein
MRMVKQLISAIFFSGNQFQTFDFSKLSADFNKKQAIIK